MLDLERMRSVQLAEKPMGQRFMGAAILGPLYNVYPRVRIEFENAERVPEERVIFAMNHTDKFNYFPFQYRWWRDTGRLTAAWVKGKYFENRWTSRFLQTMCQLPAVSRGYIISKDFSQVTHRRPSGEQYEALRRWVDSVGRGETHEIPAPGAVPPAVLEQARTMLGRPFDPQRETYAEAVNALFGQMMGIFVDLNENALRQGLDLLIFPEGTRSRRLSRGRIGISQMALKLRRTIIPIGCSGSDLIYPTSSPFPRSGRVIYRFGEPITYEDMMPWHIGEDYQPFTNAAEAKHRATFQGLSDHIMDRINDLLDPAYRFSEDRQSRGVQGSDRFL